MTFPVQTFHEVQDLVLRFWAIIDETSDEVGASLFADGGALVIESFRATGAEELGRYFAARRALSVERQRATRHVCSNLRALPGEGLRLAATMMVFSAAGTRPLPLGAPSSLADFTFDCVETSEGWKFAQITGALIFAGADTPDLKKAAEAAKGAA